MRINHLETFKEKIASGRTALGPMLTSYAPALTELAADCGMDFVWIDMEHSPLTVPQVMTMVMALRGTECAPFVRVPWNVPWLLKPVLDLAPAGVIVPMVNDREAAERAVRACRYPSEGGERGFATRRQTGFGAMPLDEYLGHSRHDPMVIVQIEHREAVEHIDDILQVEGVDSICIGPFDLSSSYGKTGRFDDPEVIAAIDTVRERTLAAGKLLGGFCANHAFWGTRRMHWKTVSCDTDLLAEAYRAQLRKFGGA